MAESAFEGFVILELMGHRRLGGFLREQEIGGASFLRIDVPGADGEPVATQFYAPAAVYCITPTTEEIARAVAVSNRPAPVQRWELPEPAPKRRFEEDDFEQDEDPDAESLAYREQLDEDEDETDRSDLPFD